MTPWSRVCRVIPFFDMGVTRFRLGRCESWLRAGVVTSLVKKRDNLQVPMHL